MAAEDTQDDPAENLIGRELEGKYRLTSILGRGAMGVVFKAEHLFMDRPVAVKMLHKHLVEDEEWLKRFRHEAKIASMLHHPHSVSIYDYGVCDGLPYLAMEFVEGAAFNEMLVRTGRVEWSELAPIVEQVCSVLEEAHSLGIVHRDIKPENIFITREPSGKAHVRVLDFGVAKLLQSSGVASTVATQHGMFLGTPRYASPEQALAKPLDGRSDIYALGVVMYEALLGSSPFTGSNPIEVLLQRVSKDPQRVADLDPGIPREVSDLVAQCLARDPASRFQSAADLAGALKLLRQPGERSPGFIWKKSYTKWSAGIAAVLIVLRLLFSGGDNQSEKKNEPVTTTTLAISTPAPTTLPTALPTAWPTWTAAPNSIPTRSVTSQPDLTATPAPTVTWTSLPGGWSPYDQFNQTPVPTSAPVVGGDELALFNQGYALYRAQRFSEAIPYFEEAIRLNPNRVESHLSLEVSYARVGMLGRAQVEAMQTVQRFPDSAPAYFELACVFALENQPDAALDALERAIALNPKVKQLALQAPDLASIRGSRRFQELTSVEPRRRGNYSSPGQKWGQFLNRFGQSVQGVFRR